MDQIFQRLLKVMETDWPIGRHEWKAIQKRMNRRWAEIYKDDVKPEALAAMGQDFSLAFRDPGMAFSLYVGQEVSFCLVPAVLLTRELGLKTMYATAMYELTKWYPFRPGYANLYTIGLPVRVRADLLSCEDVKTLLAGKDILILEEARIFEAFEDSGRAWSAHPKQDDNQCHTNMLEALERIRRWVKQVNEPFRRIDLIDSLDMIKSILHRPSHYVDPLDCTFWIACILTFSALTQKHSRGRLRRL